MPWGIVPRFLVGGFAPHVGFDLFVGSQEHKKEFVCEIRLVVETGGTCWSEVNVFVNGNC